MESSLFLIAYRNYNFNDKQTGTPVCGTKLYFLQKPNDISEGIIELGIKGKHCIANAPQKCIGKFALNSKFPKLISLENEDGASLLREI